MSFKRFFVSGVARVAGALFPLDKESLAHARVARIREGEEIELLDGAGNYWRGVFEKESVKIKETGLAEKHTPEIILAVGVTQGGTFEEIIKQATQLGVVAVVPLKSKWSAPGLDEKRTVNKLERWEKILEEACKQSGSYYKPQISAPVEFVEAVEKYKGAQNIVAALEEKITPWKSLELKTSPIIVWIGPEGDFSKEEYTALRNAGASFVGLGKTVLRVETACVTALAAVKLSVGLLD